MIKSFTGGVTLNPPDTDGGRPNDIAAVKSQEPSCLRLGLLAVA